MSRDRSLQTRSGSWFPSVTPSWRTNEKNSFAQQVADNSIIDSSCQNFAFEHISRRIGLNTMSDPKNPNPIVFFAKLPRTVRWLIAGMCVNNLGNLIGPFLTVVVVSKFGLPATTGAFVVSAFGVGSVVSIIAGGYFTDRFGRRNTLLLSLLGGGALALLLGFVTNIGLFLSVLFLFGFINELYRPAAFALFTDLVPSHDRVMALAVVRVATNIGITTSMFLGGIFLDWNWRYLFWLDGATTVLFGLVVIRLIHDTASVPGQKQNVPALRSILSPWTDRMFALFLFGSLIFGAVFMTHLSVIPLTVTRAAGLSNARLGILLGISSFIAVAFELSLTQILNRFLPMAVVTAGAIFAAAGLGGNGLYLNWYWFLLMMVIWTIGEMTTISRLMAFAADRAPADKRGAYLASWQATWRVATVLSPLIFLPLYDAVTIKVLSAIIAGVAVPAVVVFLYLHLRFEKN